MPLVNEKAWCCWQLCCDHVDNYPKDRAELQDGADLREWQRNSNWERLKNFCLKVLVGCMLVEGKVGTCNGLVTFCTHKRVIDGFVGKSDGEMITFDGGGVSRKLLGFEDLIPSVLS